MIIASGKVVDFIALILIWAVAAVFVWVIGGERFTIRRMAAIDVIEEAVGRAVETDKAVVMNIGGGGLLRGEPVPLRA